MSGPVWGVYCMPVVLSAIVVGVSSGAILDSGGLVQSAGQDAREGNAVFLVAWIVEFSDWFW